MGPVNWLAVVLAPCVAVFVAWLWHGPLFGAAQPDSSGRLSHGRRDSRKWWQILIVMAIASVMLGHNYARIGADTLAEKPWLYFMQSGGLAIAFVIPAVWITYSRRGMDTFERLITAFFWLAAYLSMGATFWLLG